MTVNAVCPGYMATDMTAGLGAERVETIERRSPLGRLPTTREVASLLKKAHGQITVCSVVVHHEDAKRHCRSFTRPVRSLS